MLQDVDGRQTSLRTVWVCRVQCLVVLKGNIPHEVFQAPEGRLPDKANLFRSIGVPVGIPTGGGDSRENNPLTKPPDCKQSVTQVLPCKLTNKKNVTKKEIPLTMACSILTCRGILNKIV